MGGCGARGEGVGGGGCSSAGEGGGGVTMPVGCGGPPQWLTNNWTMFD